MEGGLSLDQRLARIEEKLDRVVTDHERRLTEFEAAQRVDNERQDRLRQEVDDLTGRVNTLATGNAVLSVLASLAAAMFGK